MPVSLFDLFSIGIGPSSSHTVGPMRAAHAFLEELSDEQFNNIATLEAHLYGSLAMTGKGHATDKATLMGLEGYLPESIDPAIVEPRLYDIITQKTLNLAGKKQIPFDINEQLIFHFDEFLPEHANGMRFDAFDQQGNKLIEKTYFSIGGGFISDLESFHQDNSNKNKQAQINKGPNLPYLFSSAKQLLTLCKKHNKTIAELMWANERAWRSDEQIKAGILELWQVMDASIAAGTTATGILPGGLDVKRRAPELYKKLKEQQDSGRGYDPMSWLAQYSIAVNEENAAAGRVVTAPTNGAAGTIPATIKYYLNFEKEASEQGLIDFILTAAAIGILYKKGASISAAEVGCQGEVGVACSMAAAGFAAALGATVEQVENAAEIGMEHHLGLTCDPIEGLVQIPCIERNVMGATQAIAAARLAMLGDGEHKVSLDKVIKTMLQTGKDMMSTYKETSQGGLAVNLPEC
ncbi:L-serine ammonia-lyase [Piscirickettsia litoralis]|uniref:L-serine dehydratase n=1 Tax=Piscirickettsia litoralis TaxID=1891921 RepID=A0ABX3A3I3_9GAMM|nr:L-serine ammonia-lyase [Piscirickettsia litoralis]ODN43437.1 L-serine ammonia-lyase [Piscirickettsia litoralis]